MKSLMRGPLVSLFVLFGIVGCGVSPSVLVEPAPGNTYGRPARTAVSSSAGDTGAAYVVVRGDTLYGIAFRSGVDIRDLIGWNGISNPNAIYPGQRLSLTAPGSNVKHADARRTASNTSTALLVRSAVDAPTSTTSGPQPLRDDAYSAVAQPLNVEAPRAVVPASSRSTPIAVEPSPPAPGKPGSLIAAIGATPQPSTTTTSPSPGFKPATSSPLSSVAPVVDNDRVIAVDTRPATANATLATAPLPPAVSSTPVPVAAQQSPVSTPVLVDSSGPSISRQGIAWRWPTAGMVVGRFITGDPTQQGIDISGQIGQPVLAVADGDVVYSGNGLLGYGEMIIVQHSPDYLSAYGHNQRRLVSEGSKVKSGQRIAEMGQRGSTVMLHFEIRLRGKPVDPSTYLPPR